MRAVSAGSKGVPRLRAEVRGGPYVNSSNVREGELCAERGL